jgi:hypothetical protein
MQQGIEFAALSAFLNHAVRGIGAKALSQKISAVCSKRK